jgi:23S rRNA (pseudouridine1915-N3)-methyltransferase
VKLEILAVGRLKAGPERLLVQRYQDRINALSRISGLPHGLVLHEYPESRARREEERRFEEGTQILSRAGNALVLACDERGQNLTSQDFSSQLQRWRDQGTAKLACVIGGADGLDERVRAKASLVLSFGTMTLPHQLVRILLMEQIYRALTLWCGHPYHRGDDS